MASLDGISTKRNEDKENDPAVTDAGMTSKMADTMSGHGQKRRLSLSPSQAKNPVKLNINDHDVVNNKQSAKKRVLSVNFDEIFEIEQLAGSDPVKGQTQPGNDAPTELHRGESKMAAPIDVNNRDQKDPDHKQKTIPTTPQKVRSDPISFSNTEGEPTAPKPKLQVPLNEDSGVFRNANDSAPPSPSCPDVRDATPDMPSSPEPKDVEPSNPPPLP